MYEVEQKVRMPHAEFRPAVEAAGARFLSTVQQRDTYFDHPTRDFAETDEAIRIRRERLLEGDGSVEGRLTYKGPRLETDTKTRVERETTLGDADETVAILEVLGFETAGVVEKTREQYHLEGCVICLDAVAGLGEFVEVERRDQTDSLEQATASTMQVIEDLGIGEAETIRDSYLAMVLDAGNHGSHRE